MEVSFPLQKYKGLNQGQTKWSLITAQENISVPLKALSQW